MLPRSVQHNTSDTMTEGATQVSEAMDDAQAKDQLAAILSYLSQQGSAGRKAGKSESPYPNSQASTSKTGSGSFDEGSGSGHGSTLRSQVSGSSSGNGSDSRSGGGSGFGGSDGYRGDGSTGSEQENASESSGNDQARSPPIKTPPGLSAPVKTPPGLSAPATTPPGLVKTLFPNPVDPPVEVDVTSTRKIKNKAYLKTEVPTPTAIPTPQAGGPKPDGSPLASLLHEVLLLVAKTCPPEDTTALCGALSETLSGMLSNMPAPAPQTMNPQTMYVLQQELQRQQMQSSTQLVAPEFLAQIQNSMPFVAPEPAYITPDMLTAAHNVAADAAQQAAAAWRQQQANVEALAWEQEMMIHQAIGQQANGFDASMVRKPVGLLHQAIGQQANGFDASMVAPVARTCPPFSCDPRMSASFIPAQLDLSLHLPSGSSPNSPGCWPTEASGYVYPGHLGVPVPMHSPAGSDFHPCQSSCAASVSNSNCGSSSGKGGGRSKGANHVGTGKGKGKNSKAQDGAVQKGAGNEGGPKSQVVGQQQQQQQQEGFDQSLRTNLEVLHSMDNNRIVLARKINRLGFESGKVLEAFFAKYGQVDRVLVSHCHAKARNLRFRPAGLGFVVMSCVEEAEAILADGPDLQVAGAMINVQPFKPLMDDDGEMEARS